MKMLFDYTYGGKLDKSMLRILKQRQLSIIKIKLALLIDQKRLGRITFLKTVLPIIALVTAEVTFPAQ